MNVPTYGVVAASTFDANNYPVYLRDAFYDVNKGGTMYKAIFAFDQDVVGGVFDYSFVDAIAYTNWLNDYIYIIIPTELVPNLTNMTDLVEDIVFGDQFDVILDQATVSTRNGIEGKVITSSVKMITCKVVRWESGDDAKLQSIIDLFNSFYCPPRNITFACKFNSIAELNEFKMVKTVLS